MTISEPERIVLSFDAPARIDDSADQTAVTTQCTHKAENHTNRRHSRDTLVIRLQLK